MQAHRNPTWHPQMDQPEVRIQKVDVVEQTAPRPRLDPRLLLGSPALARQKRLAFLNRRENAHQSRFPPARAQPGWGDLFFARPPIGQIGNLHPVLCGQCFGSFPQGLRQRLRKDLEVKSAQFPARQFPTHSSGITKTQQRPEDDDPIKTLQPAHHLRRIPLFKPTAPFCFAFHSDSTLPETLGFGSAELEVLRLRYAPLRMTTIGALLAPAQSTNTNSFVSSSTCAYCSHGVRSLGAGGGGPANCAFASQSTLP